MILKAHVFQGKNGKGYMGTVKWNLFIGLNIMFTLVDQFHGKFCIFRGILDKLLASISFIACIYDKCTCVKYFSEIHLFSQVFFSVNITQLHLPQNLYACHNFKPPPKKNRKNYLFVIANYLIETKCGDCSSVMCLYLQIVDPMKIQSNASNVMQLVNAFQQ